MMPLETYTADVESMLARYGFPSGPLSREQIEIAFKEKLSVDGCYGLACDVNAGVDFNASLKLALQNQPKVIDVTPTWASLIPVFRAILEDGQPKSVEAIWAEIGRMAEIADKYCKMQTS